jgi:hypothetical protein
MLPVSLAWGEEEEGGVGWCGNLKESSREVVEREREREGTSYLLFYPYLLESPREREYTAVGGCTATTCSTEQYILASASGAKCRRRDGHNQQSTV